MANFDDLYLMKYAGSKKDRKKVEKILNEDPAAFTVIRVKNWRSCKVCGEETSYFSPRFRVHICSTECSREYMRLNVPKYQNMTPEEFLKNIREIVNENTEEDEQTFTEFLYTSIKQILEERL